jgi:hypothetical protein
MSQDRTETRVVLVKPGDLLLIGNVGEITQEQYDQGYAAFSALLKEELNIRVVLFSGDIDIAALAEGEIPERESPRGPQTWSASSAISAMSRPTSPGVPRSAGRES